MWCPKKGSHIERENKREKYYYDYFKCWRSIFMSNKKHVYNYDIEECNQLFKRGVFPMDVVHMIKLEIHLLSLCYQTIQTVRKGI